MKYRMKILIEELNDNNARTGKEMIMRMDHLPRERSRIGVMISHWLQQANLYFDVPDEEKFPGETVDLQQVLGELKLFIKKIESGTYKIAEIISMLSTQEASFGTGVLVLNFLKEQDSGESDQRPYTGTDTGTVY